MKVRSVHVVYTALAALICLVPSLGMVAGTGGGTASDSDSVAFPQLVDEDGQFNVSFLSDAGEWFEANIAFRDELISIDSALLEHAFGTSAQSGDGGVVVGTDGWLYYADSLNDYQGTSQLSDRELFDIARQMRLMQDYVEGQGASFAFTIAPNKATLYPEHMPYYYANGRVTSEGNYERITAVLDAQGVNYVNLQDVLSDGDELLYHERDSHWTAAGAAKAAEELMDALGQGHRDWSQEESYLLADYTGDLDQMLYPAFTALLDEVHYSNAPQFAYVEEVESNFDPKISTTSAADGSLVLYRDSFGSALLPFMAEGYGSAYFSRSVPYPVAIDMQATGADTVVVERAERFLPEMASNAPLVPAAQVDAKTWEALGAVAVQAGTLRQSASGSEYVKVTGTLPAGELAVDALVYIEAVDGSVYEACPCTVNGSEGFSALLPLEVAADDVAQYQVYLGG